MPPNAPASADPAEATQPTETPQTFQNLDAMIAHYREVAQQEAQAATGEPGTEAGQPGTSTQETPPPSDKPAATDEPKPGQAPESEDESPDGKLTEEEKRYSRRDAARFATQLTEVSRERDEIRQKLQHYENTDRAVLSELVDLVGTEQQYADARDRAAQGDQDAQKRYAEMTEWRKLVGPLERRYQLQLGAQFAELEKLPGMTKEDHGSIAHAATPIVALRQMYEVGKRAGLAERTQELDALKTEVSTLRTKQVATGTQPTTPGAGTPPKAPNVEQMIDPKTGALTDEGERLVRSGALRGVALE